MFRIHALIGPRQIPRVLGTHHARIRQVATSSMPQGGQPVGRIRSAVQIFCNRIMVALGMKPAVVRKNVCIATRQTGGYIGNLDQRAFLPTGLDAITVENGKPLELDSNGYLVEFFIFNDFEKGEGAHSTYLPSALFKGKKEGDVVRFKRDGKEFELTLRQKGHRLIQQNFEETLEYTEHVIQNTCDVETPVFGKYDPYWFYTLGEEGAIYKPKEGRLQEGTSADFRSKKGPVPISLRGGEALDGKVRLYCNCVGLTNKDVDVIVNKHHLIVYAYGKDYHIPEGVHLESLSIVNGTVQFDNRRVDGYKEVLAYLRWDREPLFTKLSLEEMKQHVASTGSVSFKNGILCLSLDALQKE